MRLKKAKFFIILAMQVLSLSFMSLNAAHCLEKKQVILSLTQWRQEFVQQRQKVDEEIERQIERFVLQGKLDGAADEKYRRSLSSLTEQQRVLREKIEWINQLILRTDRHFDETSLRDFYIKQLTEMAKLSIQSNSPAENSTYLFNSYLGAALKGLIDKKDSVLEFIVGYLQYSEIVAPKSPKKYVEQRHYSNPYPFSSQGSNKPVEPSKPVEIRMKNSEINEAGHF